MSSPQTAEQSQRSAFSPQLAFVIQFHATPRDGQPPCSGRVEHMTSGTVAHFQSWSELAAFVALTAG